MSEMGRAIPGLRGFLVARLQGKSEVAGEEDSGATGLADGTTPRGSAGGWGGRCEGKGSGNSEFRGLAGVLEPRGNLAFEREGRNGRVGVFRNFGVCWLPGTKGSLGRIGGWA